MEDGGPVEEQGGARPQKQAPPGDPGAVASTPGRAPARGSTPPSTAGTAALDERPSPDDELFGRAAIIGAARPGDFPIAFAPLLLAFFAARDPFARWLQRYDPALGRRLQRALGVGDDVMARARAARAPFEVAPMSRSARKLHRDARQRAGAPGSELVFGSYCSGAIGSKHEQDLDRWGFSRAGWTRRLLAWIAMRRPAEVHAWLEASGGGPGDATPWRAWMRDHTAFDAHGKRDVAALLDGALLGDAAALSSLPALTAWTPTVRGPSRGVPSELELTDDAERLCALARVLAWPEPSPPPAVLVAAALAAPAASLAPVDAWFERQPTALDAIATPLWAWSSASAADPAAWADTRALWAEVDGPSLSGFDNDEARGGDDRLEFHRDVAALAQLLAAGEDRGIKPPLSVGLFGDWGTGKTFFLDKLEAKIDELTSSGEAAFCERVVQIRFNAWHYMDGNLWASLAVHLFDDLERQLAKGESADDRKARLAKELASRRAERERLEADKKSLGDQLKILREQAATEQQKRVERRLALADLRAVDVQAVLAANPDLAARLKTIEDAVRGASSVRAFFGRATLGFLVVTAAVLALGLYLGSALLGQLAAVIGAVVTGVTGAIGVVRRAVPRSGELIQLFAEIQARARATPSDAERQAGKDVADADVHFQELVGACTSLATDIARLEADQQQLADGQNFAKYVLQRTQSDDYRKQLGIVSILQRDFDELSRRLLIDDGGSRVQRIVLYIDDLDRCPADKVVQVLQAVHLLLSFRLFVVVVAVNPTWVLRSLEQHYVEQMGGDGGERIPAATPHAYLEKIFQIPVRVRPMGTRGFCRLIDGLTGVPGEGAAEASRVDAAAGGPADLEVRDGDPRDPSAEDVGASEGDDVGGDRGRRREPVPEPALTGEALTLDARELVYLKRLAELVPTPRAAKRLINVYRLIRAQLAPVERARFVRDGDGTFHAVMLFLAVNARFPSQALALFERVQRSAPAARWTDLRATLEPAAGSDAEWAAMWSAIPAVVAAAAGDPGSVTAPLASMTGAQLRDAAALAARYSLPGPRSAK